MSPSAVVSRAGLAKTQRRPDVENGWAVRTSLVRTVWLANPAVLSEEKVDPGAMPGIAPRLISIASPERPKKLKSAATVRALPQSANTANAAAVERALLMSWLYCSTTRHRPQRS